MPSCVGLGDEGVEVVERAEVGVDGGVAALGSPPMAHGLPGSSGPAPSVLFGPLRCGAADRVDRRQVHDVEAHVGDRGEALRRRRRSPPSLRGNSSYQAPSTRRAHGRPTAARGFERGEVRRIRDVGRAARRRARRGRRSAARRADVTGRASDDVDRAPRSATSLSTRLREPIEQRAPSSSTTSSSGSFAEALISAS